MSQAIAQTTQIPEQVGVHVMKDENGVLREYREAKRKANVGERIKVDAKKVVTVTRYTLAGHAVTDDDEVVGAWRYTVLEPTKVIHHEGKRYEMVERKAKSGEKIIAVDKEGFEDYEIGDIMIAEMVWDNGTVDTECGETLKLHEYRVLVPLENEESTAKTTPDILDLISRLSAEVTRLSKRVETLESAVEQLQNVEYLGNLIEGYKYLAEKDEDTTPKPKNREEMPLTREQIIEKAKRDVEELKVNSFKFPWNCPAKFIVNREKRTVVCLMRGWSSGKVYAKGIAKCAPDDCFNVHIGKAIALRRALGLKVPECYLNAPQPTDVKVGDIVEHVSSKGKVYALNPLKRTYGRGAGHVFGVYDKPTLTFINGNDYEFFTFQDRVKVIDDSDRQ